ncbi:MAG: RNA polymerase sigma factor [Planctomycetes bacterium]|nr:RNA polymerase sigma factor [Planctomycetota bacterium]
MATIDAPATGPAASEMRLFGADAVAQLARGDAAALAHCFRVHGPRVWRIARSLLGQATEADDAVQEVFLRVHARAAQFDGRGAFAGWLHRLAVNHCLNRLAQLRRERGRAAAIDPDALGREREPPLDVRDALERELARLPDEQRAVVVARELGGLSYQEIAQALAIPIGTVMSRLARARERLVAGAQTPPAPTGANHGTS